MPKKSNKEFAISFLKLAAAGKVDEAYQTYVADDFKHHNQFFKGDRLTLLNAMKDAHEKMPNKKFEIKSIIEENDKIVTHSLVVKANMQIIAFHMMRFSGGKIVELWDLGAPVSKDCPNENGLF
jgi:predicted SnoaL-like aldol condensation-catalyzing enzyme